MKHVACDCIGSAAVATPAPAPNPTTRPSRCASSSTRRPAAPTTPPRASSPTSSARIWNQQVLTLNQPGAGGGISAKVASQSPNDGYTLYMPATSPFLALPGAPASRRTCRSNCRAISSRSASCCSSRSIIGASHKSGITSIADLIALAKEKPGEVSYAATGRGRLTHLTMELLQARTGTKLQLVPYAGGPAQAMNDVMSGRVQLVLDGYAGLAARDQGRPDQGARRHRAGAAAGLREPADHRRDHAELLRRRLERDAGADRHARRRSCARSTPICCDRARRSRRQGQARGQRRVPALHDAGGGREPSCRSEQKTWRPILEQVAKDAKK